MTQSGTTRKLFTVPFPDKRIAIGTTITRHGDVSPVISALALQKPSPVIFISGGASMMTSEETELTYQLIEKGIVRFAESQQVTVIDGGTEAGVMQMIGDARAKNRYQFPLIGCAPRDRVRYKGFHEEDETREWLNHGHSHFVLVDAPEFGNESQTIVDMTRNIADRQRPMIGVLINGGQISEKDVYLATAIGVQRIPIVVLEGSGRKADEIATASRTGGTVSSSIIRAIVRGGKIRIFDIRDGADALFDLLQAHFDEQVQ